MLHDYICPSGFGEVLKIQIYLLVINLDVINVMFVLVQFSDRSSEEPFVVLIL